jgi:multidrug efflux system membrane fusion protein
VQLYDEPERADRAAAQARAELARLRHERSVSLMPTGAEPRDRLEERRADLDQARANVRQLDARIAQKRISAPFAGELGVRKVDLGQYLNPGDPIATLTDLDTLYVDFTVPQQELARLKIGGQVRLTADAWPGKVFVATVNAVEPRVSENTRNVAVQARLPNAGRILRPGMYVAVALELPPEKGALLVPATAIQTSAAGESVTVIRGANAAKGGKAEIVSVTPGRRIGDRVAVVRGLKPGDVVITEGQLRVQPGAPVQVSKLLAAKG